MLYRLFDDDFFYFHRKAVRCLAPEDIGYDESDGNTRNGVGSQGSTFGKKDKWRKFTVLDDPKRIFSMTARANHFMEQQVRSGHPFYVQISHYAVHVAMQTRPETFKKYQNKVGGRLHHIAAFAAMTEDLDSGVGLVLEKIKELGIEENTFIFYMADNGAVPWFPPDKKKHLGNPLKFPDDPSRNYPLRAGKWTLYEGGIRVPFLIKGPGIKPGSQSDVPVIGWDILPTIADMAGYDKTLPADLDGGSLINLLHNDGTGKVKRPFDGFVFHRFARGYPHSAFRLGDFKFAKFWNSKERYLFNIKKDIGETNDLSGDMPDNVKELERKLMDYLKMVDAEILHQYGV